MKENLIVMLIDDSSNELRLFGEILKGIDHSIHYIYMTDGKSALESLSAMEQLPDFIFLDYSMPEMDGIECLKQIKKIKRASGIPVIMYSSAQPEQYMEAARAAGAYQCVSRSINFFENCEQVAAILKTARRNK
jgi:CheY-like chemotaxis protein